LETAVTPPVSLRPYTHLINLVAQRSSLLLAGTAAGSQEYMRWVHSLEQDFGVSIEVNTIMGPDNRPAAIGGTIRRSSSEGPSGGGSGASGLTGLHGSGGPMPADCQLAFTVDGDETRCAVRYC